jgi:hypothetical protein
VTVFPDHLDDSTVTAASLQPSSEFRARSAGISGAQLVASRLEALEKKVWCHVQAGRQPVMAAAITACERAAKFAAEYRSSFTFVDQAERKLG